jgi:hypothetical protein
MKSFRWQKHIVVIVASLVCAGCAVQYFDKTTQTEHLWGVGHFKMKVAPSSEGVQAIVKGNEVLGASVKVGDDDCHVVLGWSRTTQLSVISESASVRLEWPTNDFFTVRVGSRPPFLPNGEDLSSNKEKPKKGAD